MDPKFPEFSQLFDRFKAAFLKSDFGAASDLLTDLKVLLTGFRSLPPLFADTPNAVQELTIARDIYEHAVVLSVKIEDRDAFERDFLELKPYYTNARDRLPQSPQEYPILGLNLARLLVQNKIVEYHNELNLLSSADLENPCIKHAVGLAQSFIGEGACSRVSSARPTVPHETYAYFMDLLSKTMGDEIDLMGSHKTAIFWDERNCKYPSSMPESQWGKDEIIEKVRGSLKQGSIQAEEDIDFFHYGGDRNVVASNIKLINELYKWAAVNKHGNIFLIASAGGYSGTLRNLKYAGEHCICIAAEEDASSLLLDQGDVLYSWPGIVKAEDGMSPFFYRKDNHQFGPVNIVIKILNELKSEHVLPVVEYISEYYEASKDLKKLNNNVDISQALDLACKFKLVVCETDIVISGYGRIDLYRPAESEFGLFTLPMHGLKTDYAEIWMAFKTYLMNQIGTKKNYYKEQGKYFSKDNTSKFRYAKSMDGFFKGREIKLGDVLTVIELMLKDQGSGGLEWLKLPEDGTRWPPFYNTFVIQGYSD